MQFSNSDALVSTHWLAEHLNAPDVRVVDATHHLPDTERDAREEYSYRHIPGAVFFDIEDVCDGDDVLPHMLPSPEKFSSKVRKLGLGDGNRIVVYDSAGGFMAAARVWWMFRVFGHKDVAVLDGGLQQWTMDGYPVEDVAPVVQPRHFTARVDNTQIRSMKQVLANIDGGNEQLVDTRSAGRFHATEPEPRKADKVGHVPGSINVPVTALMNPRKRYTMRSPEELSTAFDQAGVDLNRPVVAACGSGVTACVAILALHLLGHNRTAVYDGSWSEWGNHPDTPVEV